MPSHQIQKTKHTTRSWQRYLQTDKNCTCMHGNHLEDINHHPNAPYFFVMKYQANWRRNVVPNVQETQNNRKFIQSYTEEAKMLEPVLISLETENYEVHHIFIRSFSTWIHCHRSQGDRANVLRVVIEIPHIRQMRYCLTWW